MKLTSQIFSATSLMPTMAGEGAAEVDFSTTDADTAATRHRQGAIVEWVVEVAYALIGPRGGAVELARVFHVERLVRSLVVVAVDSTTTLRTAKANTSLVAARVPQHSR